MLDEKFFINAVLQLHRFVSTLSSRFLTISALAVYLYALGVLLSAVIILFAIRWRYEMGIIRREFVEDEMDSLEVEMPVYENLRMTNYQKLISEDISDEEFESSDRDYDNV
ncbi:uncharacterized protein LOC108912891 [Anoplophora glabripennis]|uniref:uncharacterized protein LOC108912891 n=1 Tax=Anoplophora glabripennis TaxID=217634 RepID=UPI0008750DD6|nr:uncharacterized protein LOC108912891 [Anoplophora glabripennis]